MDTNDINGINEIKALSLDMINSYGYGYPGITLAVAPIIYTIYTRHININKENPNWINRDRFVLSSAGATPSLYATLHICGYPISKEDLMNYGSINSPCSIMPDQNTVGVDATVTNGGDGISTGVGIALGERYIEDFLTHEDKEQKLINFYTYVVCSDADIMSGISYESLTFAGSQNLNKLIIVCSRSNIINDGVVSLVSNEDLIRRFLSIGFYTEEVKNNEVKSIDKALSRAKRSNKPSFILVNTILGQDSRYENTNTIYNTVLNDDDIYAIKRKLNVTVAPFEVRKDTLVHVENLIKKRTTSKYNEFVEYFNKVRTSVNPDEVELLRMLVNKNVEIPFNSSNYRINNSYKEDLRLSNHKVMNIVASKSKALIGGSSDMASITYAYLDNTLSLTEKNKSGRNINFGLREQAMGGIINGLATLGFKSYASTTLINADKLIPFIRLSSYSSLPTTYIFSNDSIHNNKDGAVLTPIEQITHLRSIPNVYTFRPSDIIEIFGVWEYISKNKKTCAIILNNQITSKIDNSNASGVLNGGYIIRKEEDNLDGILISTGSEVTLSIRIAEDLKTKGLSLRVVSMPSIELFKENNEAYQEMVIPKNIKSIVIEASNDTKWLTITNNIIGINDFSYNGEYLDILKRLEFDYDSIKEKVYKILK